MPKCQGCGENAEELQMLKVDGKAKKLCDDCAEAAKAEATVAEESEAAVQQMMGYKGRR